MKLKRKIGAIEGIEAKLQRELQQVKVSVTFISSYLWL